MTSPDRYSVANLRSAHPDLATYLDLVDESIDQAFSQSVEGHSFDTAGMRDYAKGGKKVRSLSLILWAIGTADPNPVQWDLVKSSAAAIELAHRSTLVSDDIVDGQDIRNGRPTLRSSIGAPFAVLAASYMQATAIDICPETCQMTLNRAIKLTQAGQIRQHLQRFTSLDEVYRQNAEIVRWKASSFEFAALSIASSIVGGQESAAIGEIARYLGRAYQLCNDISDLSEWLHGGTKELPRDLTNRTFTYPILLAMDVKRSPDAGVIFAFMEGLRDVPKSSELLAAFQKADIQHRVRQEIEHDLTQAHRLSAQYLRPGNAAELFAACVTSIWKSQYLPAGAS